MGYLPPTPRIRNRNPTIRSAMRSPPMTATSIRTTQNYGRRRSGSMKTASRSPTNPRKSTAIPAFGPIPGKGKFRPLSYLIVSSRRRRKQNHRTIGSDDRDPRSACNPCQQPVEVAASSSNEEPFSPILAEDRLEYFRRRMSPSHGENRGSSPLGSASYCNNLVKNHLHSTSPYGKYTE